MYEKDITSSIHVDLLESTNVARWKSCEPALDQVLHKEETSVITAYNSNN